jgi:hypothetical protein
MSHDLLLKSTQRHANQPYLKGNLIALCLLSLHVLSWTGIYHTFPSAAADGSAAWCEGRVQGSDLCVNMWSRGHAPSGARHSKEPHDVNTTKAAD